MPIKSGRRKRGEKSMADIQNIYSILLARDYQETLFSRLTGQRKKEGRGADCSHTVLKVLENAEVQQDS